MGRSPFAAKEFASKAGSQRRRSTRIDYVTPVVLIGRDATGQSFREETVTAIANLHGAKVRTNYAVMVGMIVTVEVVRTGQGGKAVCVQVYEPSPGETLHNIAVQLVQPGNIWGVENPPPDWETVEGELGGRHFAAKATDPKASAINMRPVLQAPSASALSKGDVDALFADLEKRSARLMESVLDILRIQADGTVRSSIEEVGKRVESIVAAAEPRLQQRADQVGVELEMTLEAFRTEAMGEVVREALQGFQQRLDALSKELELRMTRRSEQAVADFEAKLGTAQQRLGRQAAEVEGKVSQLSQALGESEAGLKSFQEHQEKLIAEGDTHLKRFSEATLGDFEAKLDAARKQQATQAAEAEARISRVADQAMADFDAALQTFRADVGDELAARREEVVASTEQVLRTRLAALLSTIIMPPSGGPTSSPTDSKTKK